MNKDEILSGTGTGEVELLSFVIDKCTYGVSVSKVSEIIKYQHITPIPNSDPRICGVFMPRDEIISVFDLRYSLIQEQSTEENSDFMIICKFGEKSVAYPVDEIIGINRLPVSQIIEPSAVLKANTDFIEGIIKLENTIISILDFESIMSDINIDNSMTKEDLEALSNIDLFETEIEEATETAEAEE